MWLKTLLNADWRRQSVLKGSCVSQVDIVAKAKWPIQWQRQRDLFPWSLRESLFSGIAAYGNIIIISVVLAKQSDKELHVTWFKEVALKGKCLAVKILTTLQNLIYWKSRIVLLARNPVRTVSYNRSTENKSTPFEGMTLFYFPQSRCSRSVWRQQEHVKIKWPINSTILKNRYNLLVEP